MVKILETQRLNIREFCYGDIEQLMRHSTEESRKLHLADEIFDTVEKATDLITMCIANYKKKEYPLPYAVELKNPQILIGHILLCPIECGIEIGYFISESYQNKGYATEAIKAFSPWAKATFHLDILYAEVWKSNIASWKAVEKAGYTFLREREQNHYGALRVFKEYTF